MNNGGAFAIGFAIGWAVVSAIFKIIEWACIILYHAIALSCSLIWRGCKTFFGLFKKTKTELE